MRGFNTQDESLRSELAGTINDCFEAGRYPMPAITVAQFYQRWSDLYCDYWLVLATNDGVLTQVKIPGDIIQARQLWQLRWDVARWFCQLRDEVAAYQYSNLWC